MHKKLDKKPDKILFIIMLLSFITLPPAPVSAHNLANFNDKYFITQTPNLNPKVLNLALELYECTTLQHIKHKEYLTIIDYSQPSNMKRLWLFDMTKNKLLLNTWVTHGMKSGELYTKYFSNRLDSHKSSIGLYLTGVAYTGQGGYSTRLKGMSPGFNDNAYKRALVVHGAWYVSQDFINKYGRVGRTWGCPAVSDSISKSLVDIIKNGSILFSYYPDKQWEHHPTYLSCKIDV